MCRRLFLIRTKERLECCLLEVNFRTYRSFSSVKPSAELRMNAVMHTRVYEEMKSDEKYFRTSSQATGITYRSACLLCRPYVTSHHILPQQLHWCCIVTTFLNYEMPHSTMCYEILWKIDVVRRLVVGLLFSSRLVGGLSAFPK